MRYWDLSSQEVEANKYFSKGQHRGNVGEGQLHLNRENISEFASYEIKPVNLLAAIRNAYQRQQEGRVIEALQYERTNQEQEAAIDEAAKQIYSIQGHKPTSLLMPNEDEIEPSVSR